MKNINKLIQSGRVHSSVYTDSAIFEVEIEKIFRANWVFLLHESQIPNVNDFQTIRVGGRPLIVVRRGDNDFQVLLNRCPHRGAKVCRNSSGNSKTFTCPYHGWKFKNSGQAFIIPGQDAYGEGFDKNRFSMRTLPRVESYRGFVFGSSNKNVVSLGEHLGHARKYLDEWLDQGGDIKVSKSVQRYEMHCNWKLIFDNAGDGYHVPFSHQSLIQMTTLRHGGGDMQYFGNADETEMKMYSLGNGHSVIDQRPEMYKFSAWNQQRPQPGRESFESNVRNDHSEPEKILDMAVGAGLNLNIFPNLLLIGNQIQVIDPISVNKTVLHWYATLLDEEDEELNAIRMRTQEDFPIMGEVDDAANFESCQEGLESMPEIEWVDISRHMKDTEDANYHNISTDKPTSEIHSRGYFETWKRLMSEDPDNENFEV
ncbi:aromatic ring-hydroxylating oxygenase subunit alpha [Pseudomonas rhizophila]